MSGFAKEFNLIRGKTLAELPTLAKKAFWLRIYDEAHNPREYMQWNADGTQAGIARKLDGTPRSVSWSFFKHIEKAISIAQDGSPENISRQLGLAHKIRNFYNNQADPDNPRYLTIDTHAGAAAQLRPLSGSHPDILRIFGNPSNSEYGLKGVYPLYDEMYRRAAKTLDEPIPNRVQSPVWAKFREVFNDDFKTPENLKAIDAIWKESTDGKITANDARERIWDFATRWNRAASERGRIADNQGKLFATDVPGASTSGTVERGNGAGVTPPPAAEEVGDTSFEFGANVKPEEGSFSRPAKKSKAKTQLSATDLIKALGGLKKPAK